MWFVKLTLTTLWMAGMVAGWTMGGLLHLLAIAAVALVFIEETPIEQKLKRFRFHLPHASEGRPRHAVGARPI